MVSEEQEYMNKWFSEHEKKMLDAGIYIDPCKDCSGEDCACCSYRRRN